MRSVPSGPCNSTLEYLLQNCQYAWIPSAKLQIRLYNPYRSAVLLLAACEVLLNDIMRIRICNAFHSKQKLGLPWIFFYLFAKRWVFKINHCKSWALPESESCTLVVAGTHKLPHVDVGNVRLLKKSDKCI